MNGARSISAAAAASSAPSLASTVTDCSAEKVFIATRAASSPIVSIAETMASRELALRLPFFASAVVCAVLVPYLWHRASTARIDAAIAEAEAEADQ